MSKLINGLTKEFLLEHYVEKRKSCQKLAKELNCSATSIFNALKRHNIPTWNRGDYSKDLINKQFTLLQAIKKHGLNDKGEILWTCRCECGKQLVVKSGELIRNKKKSCGCVKFYKTGCKSPIWKGYGEISASCFNSVKKRSKIKGYKFNLTIEYLWELYLIQERKCALSGVPISFARSSTDYEFNTASLDRKNNKLDYTTDNVQWVHKTVNFMKHTLDEDIFVNFCTKIATFSRMAN